MQCFEALGFREMPASREEITTAYEQRKKAECKTESERLAARLLAESYHGCLRAFDAGE